MIKELIKIANELDARGLSKESDLVDKIIKSASLTAKLEDDENSVKILEEFTAVNPKTGYGRLVAKVDNYLHPEQPTFVEYYFGGRERYIVYVSYDEKGYTGDSFDDAVAVNKSGEKVPETYLKYVEFAKPILYKRNLEIRTEVESSPMGPRFHWEHLFSGSKEMNERMDDQRYESLKEEFGA